LRQQRASPNFLSNETFSKAVYGLHPASRISATAQSIDAFTPELLAKWHRERYTPQNSLLAIAGDVQASELIPKLEKWLSVWKQTDLKEVLPANPKAVPEKRVYIVDRPNSVQTSIMLGNIAIDRRDPDHPALTVFNHILGGSGAARLFLNLREEKGYTYGVYSSFTALKFPGPWRAYGDVRTEVTEGAMTEFFREFQRIRDERVSTSELDDAKPQRLLGYVSRKNHGGFVCRRPADRTEISGSGQSATGSCR
jgi:zinc protease